MIDMAIFDKEFLLEVGREVGAASKEKPDLSVVHEAMARVRETFGISLAIQDVLCGSVTPREEAALNYVITEMKNPASFFARTYEREVVGNA